MISKHKLQQSPEELVKYMMLGQDWLISVRRSRVTLGNCSRLSRGSGASDGFRNYCTRRMCLPKPRQIIILL